MLNLGFEHMHFFLCCLLGMKHYIISFLKEPTPGTFPTQTFLSSKWEIKQGHILTSIFIYIILSFVSSFHAPVPHSTLLGKWMLYKAGFQKGFNWFESQYSNLHLHFRNLSKKNGRQINL